jgi:hypothetical protein
VTALNPLPLLKLDPDVLCARSCGRVAQLSVELDATTNGTPAADLLCEPCCDDLEAA